MIKQHKEWIDEATYKELLTRWRNASVGDTIFQDDTGTYYAKVMAQKKALIPPEQAIAVSKQIGWGGKYENL
jgi:hypothetical protein